MIAYLDCFAGASGDMILAALIDAGADLDAVTDQLSRMELPGEITLSDVQRCGMRAARLEVEGPDEPFVSSYGQGRKFLQEAGLDPEIEERAISMLARLSEAEARIHGTTPEKAHFHELSGLDTLVDLVGVAAAFRALKIERVVASPVATGKGWVSSAGHGPLPLPAPAALELLKGGSLYGTDIQAELVTPTGAAILAEYAGSFGEMPPMTISAVGYGAGARELEIPNVIRVVLGEPLAGTGGGVDELLVEATIDDMNPEFYGFVTERLLAVGASDVWILPAIGKQGRPAQVIQVLAPPPMEGSIRDVLIAETSTLGVRTIPVRKWMLARDWVEVEVGGRPVRVKVGRHHGQAVNVAPEYSDCAEVARRTGRPVKEIFRQALEQAVAALSKGRDDEGGTIG